MDGELQRTVGRNIRRIRLAGDLSQEDLADRIGHHRTYLGSVERGEHDLSLRSLERLAASLGVDPVALLTPVVAPAPGEPDGPGDLDGPGDPDTPDLDGPAPS
ncbi:helix-turn-helix domain-containing protein [Cellulomonas sp. Y8]|uniref:helix-turn-helix domain-containing protein n=1 Tax=Cellulomonas sp. Y8 TaxID=2591145 RepID=UPI003D70A911